MSNSEKMWSNFFQEYYLQTCKISDNNVLFKLYIKHEIHDIK